MCGPYGRLRHPLDTLLQASDCCTPRNANCSHSWRCGAPSPEAAAFARCSCGFFVWCTPTPCRAARDHLFTMSKSSVAPRAAVRLGACTVIRITASGRAPFFGRPKHSNGPAAGAIGTCGLCTTFNLSVDNTRAKVAYGAVPRYKKVRHKQHRNRFDSAAEAWENRTAGLAERLFVGGCRGRLCVTKPNHARAWLPPGRSARHLRGRTGQPVRWVPDRSPPKAGCCPSLWEQPEPMRSTKAVRERSRQRYVFALAQGCGVRIRATVAGATGHLAWEFGRRLRQCPNCRVLGRPFRAPAYTPTVSRPFSTHPCHRLRSRRRPNKPGCSLLRSRCRPLQRCGFRTGT
jgi:hypothetical protein